MKKLLSIILMASMIVTLTPIACGGALTQNVAYADSGNTGSGDGSVATTPVTPTITWTETQDANDSSKNIKTASVTSESELTTAIGAVNNAEANTTWVIKLDGDIAIGSTLNITKIVTLDLNGHVLSLAQDKTGSVIKVTDGGLTLEDSNTSTEHKFSQTAKGQWYLDDINGTKTITGGVITGGNNVENGGGVCVGVGKTFNMNGGTIFGCNAKYGGGICILGSGLDNGVFNMQGDSLISDCKAESGGGVYIVGGRMQCQNFNMYAGTIRNCHASYEAGGVYVNSEGEDNKEDTIRKSIFNMSGGLIEGCTAQNTSAVYVVGFSSFTMSGGTIRKCKSVSEDNRTVCIKDADFELNGTSEILGIIYWLDEERFAKNLEKLEIGQNATVYSYYDKREFVDYLKDRFSLVKREAPQFREYKIKIDGIEGETLYAHQVKDSENGTIVRPANPEIPGYEAVEADKGKDSNCIWYDSDTDFDESTICNFSGKGNWDTLYTRMTMKTNYTIKFDTGGGTGITDKTNVSWDGKVLDESIENPTKAGYTFKGWIYKSRELTTDGWVDKDINVTSDTTYKTLVPDDDATGDTITLVAQWEKNPVSYGGGSSRQHPTVAETEHGTITLASNGRTATITPDEGYEIASVTVNGENKGAVALLIGLRTGDKIAATFQKTKDTLDTETKAAVASLSTLKARSSKTAKGNVKVIAKLSTAEKAKLAELTELGYTVKYKFYRTTKKSSNYTAMLEGTTGTYYNTSGESGTRYYYKAQIRVYDANGTLVAKTALKDCKYACRKF